MLVAAADGFGLTESNGKPWRWDNVVGLHAQDCRALVDDPVFLSASAGPGVVGRRSTDPCSPAIGASSGAVPGSRNGSQATRHWLSRGRARNGRHRHRGGVRLSVDRRRRASGGRRDGLAPVRAVALGWPSRGFVRRSTGVAIRSCLSEPVTPSGQASLSHEARVAVGGIAPSWRLRRSTGRMAAARRTRRAAQAARACGRHDAESRPSTASLQEGRQPRSAEARQHRRRCLCSLRAGWRGPRRWCGQRPSHASGRRAMKHGELRQHPGLLPIGAPHARLLDVSYTHRRRTFNRSDQHTSGFSASRPTGGHPPLGDHLWRATFEGLPIRAWPRARVGLYPIVSHLIWRRK
jgi:hypothetical protein